MVVVKPVNVYFCMVVDAKGPTRNAMRQLAEWIKLCGLVRFLWRSDGERALRSLLDVAIRESGRDGKRLVLPSDPPDEPDQEEQQTAGPSQPPPQGAPTELAVPEGSHVGESQSNGVTERGVQLAEDQARTLKAALEDHLGWTIPATHPLMHWLLRHAAYPSTNYHVCHGGFGFAQLATTR